MIVELGAFALCLALALSVAQSVAAFAGRSRDSLMLIRAGEGAALAAALTTAIAFVALIYAFVQSDFSVLNVALNSHTDKPLLYKFAAAWGSHEGSMLLWVLMLTGFGASVVLAGQNLPNSLRAGVVGTQGGLATLFLAYTVLASNPFVRMIPTPIQGRSLNPVLQDPALAAHPPFLYAGYVGFSVVFSFAVAALLDRRVDSAWARWVRPWALAAWALLTVGITLGSFWAYYELGWGGWWFWDPVENASFLPWLAGAALLHSAIVTERRGALAGWSVFLALLAFSLSMLGAFLVRSGVLTSVHAFAVDPTRGVLLLGILGFAAGSGFALFAWRGASLSSTGAFAPISRESALLLNNLLLCAGAATILTGTLYPLVIEAIGGDPISVGPPYFNLTFAPMMAVLVLLVPFGPMLAWKRGDGPEAARRLWWAAAAAIVLAILTTVWASPRPVLAAVGAGLGTWLIFGALAEPIARVFAGGPTTAERLRRLRGLPLATWGATLAHAGLGVFVLGACLQTAGRVEVARVLTAGQSIVVGERSVRLANVTTIEGANFLAERGVFESAGRIVTADRRFYPAGGQTTTEVGLSGHGFSDLYVVLGERRAVGGAPAWLVTAYWNPYARLIFLGPLIMALGGAVSLVDRRLRVATPGRPRTHSPLSEAPA